MSNLVLARIVLLALAGGFVLAGLGFSTLMIHYRSTANRRMLFGVPLLVLLAGIVFVQLVSYTNLSGVRRPIDNDVLFFWVVICENLLAIVAIFYSAYRRRKLQ